ncbi:hypothetical protein BS47DRAFT_1304773 [Hydnum rufescens UP504]|uniref:Methyltransferase small domain-containing protein n=1 Tax=Hydnum rufescens UP504 TaxID=1448309 RepID=A0A9P6AJP4_9AGAM|nr:hypothetical protein BS47DRAFT_1304773 [Hydnum rufescens UP504]
MIPTPDLSHLTPEDFEEVYDPAEDTFLLLDALEHDVGTLKGLCPRLCIEIGSGSGCVSSFLAGILGPSHALYLCTDINARAALCTARTGAQNNTPLDPVVTSFASPLMERLKHSVDILLFNPPYVPTSISEASAAQDVSDGVGIASAWAGGMDGMEVTNQFLAFVDDLLAPRGLFYLVAVAPNNISDITTRMKDSYGLKSHIVLERRAGREHLFVIKFARPESA